MKKISEINDTSEESYSSGSNHSSKSTALIVVAFTTKENRPISETNKVASRANT